MAEGQVVLNREEAQLLADLLDDHFQFETRLGDEEERRRWFRLAVKIDQALGNSYSGGGGLNALPNWQRSIIHRTFAPPQVPPKKKPAPTKAGGGTPVKPAAAVPKRGLLPKGAGLGLKAGAD